MDVVSNPLRFQGNDTFAYFVYRMCSLYLWVNIRCAFTKSIFITESIAMNVPFAKVAIFLYISTIENTFALLQRVCPLKWTICIHRTGRVHILILFVQKKTSNILSTRHFSAFSARERKAKHGQELRVFTDFSVEDGCRGARGCEIPISLWRSRGCYVFRTVELLRTDFFVQIQRTSQCWLCSREDLADARQIIGFRLSKSFCDAYSLRRILIICCGFGFFTDVVSIYIYIPNLVEWFSILCLI